MSERSNAVAAKPAAPVASPVPGALLQRQCACGQHRLGSECGYCKKTTDVLQRHPAGGRGSTAIAPIVHEALRSSGRSLDSATRIAMEPRFGRDFSRVRIHTGPVAAASTRAVDALAYTVGSDVVFGESQYAPGTSKGRHLLAHELVHVVQQSAPPARSGLTLGTIGSAAEREADTVAGTLMRSGEERGPLQVREAVPPTLLRYEAGEHAQFGEAGDELKVAIAARTFTYRVKPGEHLARIAAKFGLEPQELKAANSAKVKKWRATAPGGGAGGGNVVEGFTAGEEITIPPVLNEFTKDGLKAKELVFTLNGVKLDYGEGIAMGDFYEDAGKMLAAPASELTALSALIKKEKSGTPVTTKEWNDATGGRYTKLAEKNEAHFAPSNPKLVAVSSAPHGSDNKTEWEKNHKTALDKSQGGSKEEALQTNSYADHYLTDAFSAGHLVNKRDVMETFKGGLTKNPKGEYTGDAKAFFDSVATTSFVGNVKTEFSKYSTVASYNSSGHKDPKGWFHPSINDKDRFSSLLQSIQDTEPDVVSSVVAKSIHDSLSTKAGGVSVENLKGDKWDLSGDGTLNAKSKEVARKAVAQSQLNIFDAFKAPAPLDYPPRFKKVWDYVPTPTTKGETDIKATVASGTDPKDAGLVRAVVALVNSHYLLILSELVKRGYLKR
jgi:hypothetical protein